MKSRKKKEIRTRKLSNKQIVKKQAKSISQLVDTVYDLQIAKQKAESNANDYFAALIVKQNECRKLKAELNKPIWKRLLGI